MKEIDPLSGWKEPDSLLAWANGISPKPNNAWFEYVNLLIKPDLVTVIARLLIPSFVEHDGGVFLYDQFSLAVYEKWKEQFSDISAIEKVMNHQHVYDIFSESEQIPEASYEGVAQVMAASIKMSLFYSFPNRSFRVFISNSEADYGPTIVFHSVSMEADPL